MKASAATLKLVSVAIAVVLALPALPASAQDDVPVMEVAANFEGLWCGTGLLRGGSLELSQHRRKFEGMLRYRNRERVVKGDIEGSVLRTFTEKAGELVLELEGARLRIQEAGGNLALARGQSFVRANGSGCA